MTEKWLSLGGAARMLGVHPGTVRMWSDKGILPVHKTQGGHRRYKYEELSLWAKTHNKPAAIEPEQMMQEVTRNVRMQISVGRLQAEEWYQKLDENARAQYRMSARSLFHGLMTYVATNGADAENEAYAIGYEYASRAHRYSLSYVDAARAFLFFRNALIASVIGACREARVSSSESAETLGRIYAFTDQILVSLLQTFQTLNAPR